MARFRLVKGAGSHKVDGTVYRAGDVVESQADLAKLFASKFERLSGDVDDDAHVPSQSLTPYDTAATRKSVPGQPPPVVFDDEPDALVFEDDPAPKRKTQHTTKGR